MLVVDISKTVLSSSGAIVVDMSSECSVSVISKAVVSSLGALVGDMSAGSGTFKTVVSLLGALVVDTSAGSVISTAVLKSSGSACRGLIGYYACRRY